MTDNRNFLLFILFGCILALALIFACDPDPKDGAEKYEEETAITESRACNAYCKKIIKCEIWDWASQEECVEECAKWYNGSSMGECYYECLDRNCDNFYDCSNGCYGGGGGETGF